MAAVSDYYDKTAAAAARYDALHAGQVEDVRFYVEEAVREGGPILDVGCGTGRVALPIAEAGVRVVGIDRSGPMLAKAVEKRARLEPAALGRCAFVQADMRAFAFRRGSFEQAFIPFRGFQALLEVDDQLAALNAIHAALRPGGRLVFNVFDPRLDILAAADEEPGRVHDSDRAYQENGATVRERFAAHYDLVRQILHLTFIYERVDPGGTVTERAFEPLLIRYFHRFEIEHLLVRAGYEVEDLHGTWDRQPFEENGQEMIWIARKSGKTGKAG